MSIVYDGIGHDVHTRLLSEGRDHLGLPLVPFVDDEGDWPLRCCLRDSEPGERLAIVNASPFPWTSAYRTCGPVVVHAGPCPGHDGGYPRQFEARLQIMRAYGRDEGRERTLVYDLNAMVAPGEGLEETVRRVLDDPRVEFVHVHNVLSGCFSFSARRA